MIEVQHLCKTFRVARRGAGFGQAVKTLFHREYEEVKALDDVSFSISEGEMVGYIGPNGAGKSSTIKILSGILTPDSGVCSINGRIPWKNRTAHVKDIGVVFGQRTQLWWDVPVIDSYELLKDIYSKKQIIKDGVIPEEFIFISSGYLAQCEGTTPPKEIYSHISGINLVKGKDEEWHIL